MIRRSTPLRLGTASLFDEADALQILILADLRQGGVEVRVLERVALKIRELGETSQPNEIRPGFTDSIKSEVDQRRGSSQRRGLLRYAMRRGAWRAAMADGTMRRYDS